MWKKWNLETFSYGKLFKKMKILVIIWKKLKFQVFICFYKKNTCCCNKNLVKIARKHRKSHKNQEIAENNKNFLNNWRNKIKIYNKIKFIFKIKKYQKNIVIISQCFNWQLYFFRKTLKRKSKLKKLPLHTGKC